MLTQSKNNETSSLQGHYAGFATRFLAFTIDGMLIVTGILITVGVITLLRGFFNFDEVIKGWFDTLIQNPTIIQIVRWLAAIGFVTLVSFLYNVIFWTIAGGKSLGKALVGVRIVRLDGRPITLLRAIRRYITFWLAALPFFLGLLWVLGDDRRQGWHDKLSHTCVIYDWPALKNQS